MKLIYIAQSHIGNLRPNNEDNLFANGVTLPVGGEDRPFLLEGETRAPAVFALCDGMGGEDKGEVASRTAVETLEQYLPPLCTAGTEELDGIVWDYTRAACGAIQAQAPENSGMGTTLALALVRRDETYCYNLGDSRIYVLREQGLSQVTHDHTLAAERRRNGCPDLPRGVNGRGLTRCLGTGRPQEAEGYPPLRDYRRLLLCSDGLSGLVEEAELEEILSTQPSPSLCAKRLVSLALERGGRDNISLILLEADSGGERDGRR